MCGCEGAARRLAEDEREALGLAGFSEGRRFLLDIDCCDDLTQLAGTIATEGLGKGLLNAALLRVASNHPTPCAQLQQQLRSGEKPTAAK